jgi:hypothetical protein
MGEEMERKVAGDEGIFLDYGLLWLHIWDPWLGEGLFRAPRQTLMMSGEMSLSCAASHNRG